IVVRGVQIEDPIPDAFLIQLLERFRELAEEHAPTRVDHDGDACRAARASRELGHLRQQRGWQVVDDEVAEVLEGVGGLRAAGAGHARDQRERRADARLVGIGHRVHGTRHQALTLSVAAATSWSRSWIDRASSGPIPGVAAMSSSDASRSRASEPNRLRTAFFRAGPTPGTSSSGETSARFARFWRWYVIANRWASSRMCCSTNSASDARAIINGSDRPGK